VLKHLRDLQALGTLKTILRYQSIYIHLYIIFQLKIIYVKLLVKQLLFIQHYITNRIAHLLCSILFYTIILVPNKTILDKFRSLTNAVNTIESDFRS
jgi:hypothetical protein